MTNPTSSSSSGYSDYTEFFNNINNGHIQDLQGIRQFYNGNDKDLIQFVERAADEIKDQPKYIETLTKLVKLTELDTELHNKILTICSKNNIAVQFNEEEFHKLLTKTRGIITRNKPDGILQITIIQANEQIDRLFDMISRLDKEKRNKVVVELNPRDDDQVIEKYGKYANSLTLLNIRDDNHFTSLIQNCSNISNLFISSNNITNLEALKLLPYLQTLDCSWCTGLTTLPELPSLLTLKCYGCTKLTTLPVLPRLQTLDCSNCKGLSVLPVLPDLQTLICAGCNGLTELPVLPSLQTLNCSMCSLLTVLPVLPSLIKLYCGWCTDLVSLPVYPLLQILNCKGCKKLTTLPVLPSLHTLDCDGCTNLTALSVLPLLHTLYCYECTGLTALPVLPNLRWLNCGRCTGLTELPELPNLQRLDCRGCTDLTWLPMLPCLQSLICCGCRGLQDLDLIIYLLKLKNNINDISELLKINNIERQYFTILSDYFDDNNQVTFGNDRKITEGALRKVAFNTYPILFGLIAKDFINHIPPIHFSDKTLQKSIDEGGSLSKILKEYYKTNLPIQNIPLSQNKDMPSELIIKILDIVNVKNVLLPKVPQEFYFHPNSTDQQNNLFKEQQAFCDVLCGCVRLAIDLGFILNKDAPQGYPPYLINLIQTVLKSKKKSWIEISSKLPTVLKRFVREGSHVRDAIDDFINTIALASHIRHNPHFNTNTRLEPFRLGMITEFLKNIPIGSIIEFSDKWHSLGRLAQLNKAKTFLNNSWEPLFTANVSYDIEGRKIVVLPLTTSAELTVEGTKLAHCVGGYPKKCLLENSHIISLRDGEGNPLSTIEFHLSRGNGDKHEAHIINIVGETRYHLELKQHYGIRNAPPSHLCKEIEKRLLDDIRNRIVPVDLYSLNVQQCERDRMFKTPEKRNLVLVGYEPLDDDSFNEAIKIYRKVLSDMNLSAKKTFRTNFERLIGTQQSSSKPSSSNESFFV